MGYQILIQDITLIKELLLLLQGHYSPYRALASSVMKELPHNKVTEFCCLCVYICGQYLWDTDLWLCTEGLAGGGLDTVLPSFASRSTHIGMMCSRGLLLLLGVPSGSKDDDLHINTKHGQFKSGTWQCIPQSSYHLQIGTKE